MKNNESFEKQSSNFNYSGKNIIKILKTTNELNKGNITQIENDISIRYKKRIPKKIHNLIIESTFTNLNKTKENNNYNSKFLQLIEIEQSEKTFQKKLNKSLNLPGLKNINLSVSEGTTVFKELNLQINLEQRKNIKLKHYIENRSVFTHSFSDSFADSNKLNEFHNLKNNFIEKTQFQNRNFYKKDFSKIKFKDTIPFPVNNSLKCFSVNHNKKGDRTTNMSINSNYNIKNKINSTNSLIDSTSNIFHSIRKENFISQDLKKKFKNIIKVEINLIITDDEELTRHSTIRIIKKNFEANSLSSKFELVIHETKDGLDCLSKFYYLIINGKSIFCIISDESMYLMNGSECSLIIKKIVEKNHFKKIPFYLVTAYPKENFSVYIDDSIDYLFSKPIKFEEVNKIFAELINKNRI